MADYIRFNQDGIIIHKYESVDGADIKDNPDILKVDRETFNSLTKYHIVDHGVLRLMTQAEKDALDLEEADIQHQSLLDRIDKYEITNLDLLTALVKVINKRIPNNPITKQEFVTQLRADLNV